jgi:hypothetical protein
MEDPSRELHFSLFEFFTPLCEGLARYVADPKGGYQAPPREELHAPIVVPRPPGGQGPFATILESPRWRQFTPDRARIPVGEYGEEFAHSLHYATEALHHQFQRAYLDDAISLDPVDAAHERAVNKATSHGRDVKRPFRTGSRRWARHSLS